MNTLIIVGAGGSRELDMPTGCALTQLIIQAIDTNSDYVFRNGQGQFLDPINQFLRLRGWPTDTWEDAKRNKQFFEQSLLPFKEALQSWVMTERSLDAFLNNGNVDEDWKQFGKFAIAYYILGQEEWLMRENLYSFRDNWIRSFLDEHLRPIKIDLRTGKCPARIITFNYDRNIEHFLYTFLRQTESPIPGREKSVGFDEAGSIIERWGIVHVYNPLAPLEWQTHNEQFIRYGERNNDKNSLALASEAIQLIGENGGGRVPDDKITHIRQMVREVERIYFLGVGFDLDNMKLLFGEDVLNPSFRPSSECHATAIDLRPAIKQRFPFITYHALTCAQLVQNHHIFSL